jgi:hypothetical protein
MPFVKSWNWPICICLAAALGLTATPHAFAGPEDAPRMKPAIAGFIDMQTIAWHNTDDSTPTFTLDNVNQFPDVFGGIVLNATWAEMQDQPGGPLTTARIDQALNQVRQYNAAHPTAPLGVKLRIFAGNQAPAWAKAIAGGPVTIQRNPQGCPSGNCPITIGKVWNPQYIAAWRGFQGLVAARYDSVPLIRSVAVTSCTMQTDEPFVMPVGQPAPAGYTDAAGRACLRGAVDDYAAWRRTPIDFSLNVFPQIQMGGSDPNFTIAVMNACRARLGKRCELGNHALAANMRPANAKIVAAISAMRVPIHYQTDGPKTPGFDWTATVQAARRYNATAVELWPDAKFGGFTTLTMAEMRKLSVLFSGQGSMSPSAP